MRKIYNISIILALLFSLASCDDVLDKAPLDKITDDAVWRDPVLIDGYLTECYYKTSVMVNETPGYFTGGGNYWWSEAGMGWAWINEIADEAKANWEYNTESVRDFKANGVGINGGLMEWWNLSYNVIRSLNEFIQRVPDSPMSESLKKERMAEARFLRAFNYFAMVKRYGGVPLITVPQSLDDPYDELFPKRNSEQQIYDFIISEMDDIINNEYLNEDVPAGDLGRPSKYAALALKSRAALYAGSIAQFGTIQLDGLLGIPSDLAEHYYKECIKASEEIGKKHSLYNNESDKVANFKNIFLVKNNSEVIFAKRHNKTPVSHNSGAVDGGHSWGYDFAQCPKPQSWNAGNKDAPYLEMAETFEYIDGTPGAFDREELQSKLYTTDALWKNKDPRFFATIYTQNTNWKGTKVDFHNGLIKPDGKILSDGSYSGVQALGTQSVDNSFGTGFGVMKYLDENVNNMAFPSISESDYLVFRYGEILLNLAEAAYEVGETGKALAAINKIRSRAGIKELTTVDREKIRHERRVELAFEGHRYWDVRRWRIAEDVLSKPNSGLRYILDFRTRKYKLEVLDNVDGTSFSPRFPVSNYYFPITLDRTGNNPNLVENPGYDD
ncbi:MAG: RagB/SusD family nutrient uptake outer membrane protein [Clostridiales bacterium]|nr:RagB/SusD family nutrient uptake outer membrane protein [Clostridiales bacterium]